MARPQQMQTDDLIILSVTNWTGSKAANNPDGGVASLKTWLENKSKRQIQESQLQGDVMQIAILAKDKRSFMHIDGWKWAGKDIKISEGQLDAPPRGSRNDHVPSGPRNSQSGFPPRNEQSQRGGLSSRITGGPNHNSNQNKELFGQPPSGPRGDRFGQKPNGNVSSANPFSQPQANPFNKNAQNAPDDALTSTLIEVIRARYNPNDKFLNLGSLGQDPIIAAANLNLNDTSAEKVFAAIFILCEQRIFETKEKRAEMVETISFKGNGLTSVKEILPAASTFVMLKNLDLSDNKFSHMRDIQWWRKRFPRLEQIILSGNPIDSPQTRDEVKTWYRNLKTYNMQPLDAPWVGANGPAGLNPLEMNPPVPTSSPAPGAGPNGQILSTQGHPEFQPGDTFGLPVAGKPDEQVIKEQMGLKFSYETRLKMTFVEQCLTANQFDYDKAMNVLNDAIAAGNVPADAFLQV